MKNVEIRQKIYDLINDHYFDAREGNVLPNHPKTDEYLDYAIEKTLVEIGVKDFRVEMETCFNSPGYDSGTVSVSWIGDEGLDMEVILWEVI